MKDWKEEDKKSNGGLTGSKYPIDAILNREIHLQTAKVEPSKRNDGNCLTIQYEVYEQLHDKDGVCYGMTKRKHSLLWAGYSIFHLQARQTYNISSTGWTCPNLSAAKSLSSPASTDAASINLHQ